MSKWGDAHFPHVALGSQHGVMLALVEAINALQINGSYSSDEYPSNRLDAKGNQLDLYISRIVNRMRYAIDNGHAPWDHRQTEEGLSSFDATRYRWSWEAMCDYCGGDPSADYWRLHPHWSARRALLIYKMLNLFAHQVEAIYCVPGAETRFEVYRPDSGTYVHDHIIAGSINYGSGTGPGGWDYTHPTKAGFYTSESVEFNFALRQPETIVAEVSVSGYDTPYADPSIAGEYPLQISSSADIGKIDALIAAPCLSGDAFARYDRYVTTKRQYQTLYRAYIKSTDYYDPPSIWEHL